MQIIKHQNIQKIEQFVLKYKLDHFGFWFIYGLIYSYLFHWGRSWSDELIDSLVILSFHALVSYFNNDYLIPRFLLNKQYISYILSLVLSVMGVCYPLVITFHMFINNKIIQSEVWSSAFLFFLLVSVLFTVILTMVLKLIKQWYKDQKSTNELQQMQLQTELKFLKSQINPHFLFNSLNNLYALTLKKSDLAPEVVLRLSDILRYLLYESSQGSVPLKKEIKHIIDYVEIEKLRLGNSLKIQVDIPEIISDRNIEPMIFLTLVENAFKHSESVLPEKRYVFIKAEETNQGFRFLVENSFNPSNKMKERGGIGLENIRKRLILTYPAKHSLNWKITEDVYQVDLIINMQ